MNIGDMVSTCVECGHENAIKHTACGLCESTSWFSAKKHRARFKAKPDPINPPHYLSHPEGYECNKVRRSAPSNLSQAIKYIWRVTWGSKPDTDHEEDLLKAIWYINDEISLIRKEREEKQ